MKSRLVFTALAFANVFVALNSTFADEIHANGQVSFQGSGVDKAPNSDDASGANVGYYYSGKTDFTGVKSFNGVGGDGITGHGTYSATGYANGHYGILGVSSQVNITTNSSAAFGSAYSVTGLAVTASATWEDNLYLVAHKSGTVSPLPGSGILIGFGIDGGLHVSIGSAGASINNYANASVSVYFDSSRVSYFDDVNSYHSGDDRSLFPKFFATAQLDQSMHTSFIYGITTNASASIGFAESFFRHTLMLESIKFENGQTPESLGYDVAFDSGMSSPNLSPVPEPSSLALAGLGGLGLAIDAFRRWRSVATIDRGSQKDC